MLNIEPISTMPDIIIATILIAIILFIGVLIVIKDGIQLVNAIIKVCEIGKP